MVIWAGSRVSTHSRLKAAGKTKPDPDGSPGGFNTQPPEGGWTVFRQSILLWQVSTHSRLKAAGEWDCGNKKIPLVSTHSRLKAAGFV